MNDSFRQYVYAPKHNCVNHTVTCNCLNHTVTCNCLNHTVTCNTNNINIPSVCRILNHVIIRLLYIAINNYSIALLMKFISTSGLNYSCPDSAAIEVRVLHGGAQLCSATLGRVEGVAIYSRFMRSDHSHFTISSSDCTLHITHCHHSRDWRWHVITVLNGRLY